MTIRPVGKFKQRQKSLKTSFFDGVGHFQINCRKYDIFKRGENKGDRHRSETLWKTKVPITINNNQYWKIKKYIENV